MPKRPLVWLAILVVTGCTIDDEDRCPEGYFYIPEITSCCLDGKVYVPSNPLLCVDPDFGGGEDTGENDTEDGGTGDGGTGDGGIGGDENAQTVSTDGLGTPCSDDTNCEGLDADYCAINPLEGAGYCSVNGCTPEICPGGYKCCDCREQVLLPQVAVCLTDSDAVLADSVQCTCE